MTRKKRNRLVNRSQRIDEVIVEKVVEKTSARCV